MVEKFQTLHPDPEKTGVNIDKTKYDYVKNAVLNILTKQQPLTPKQLFEFIDRDYSTNFDGSITWYAETVKLDLEARKKISHDRKTRMITLL
ncbi:TPA: hypothetical protein EYO12_04125 [Candidatus Saccharibacteria bacterium]|nr:hypothetical protein [Candidatus Saccharibacteria bacterium]HIO87778.1 hypothetical protein [Candidatus Saccharibacteria bacterium]